MRLTKAQVEALLSHVDGAPEAVRAALEGAVAILHGHRDVAAALDGVGRHDEAGRYRAGDAELAWDLVTELNELRHLAGA